MDAESATKCVQDIQRETKGLRTNGELIGTPRDSPQLRKKVDTHRRKVSDAETKLQGLLRAASHGDRVWDEINGNYRQAKRDFDQVNLGVKKKEKLTGGASSAEESTTEDSHATVNIHEFKRVDMSELATVEALQNEKLQGAKEIQQEMTEIALTYSEFNSLVKEQGAEISKIEQHVTKARNSVAQGTTELRKARNIQ